ncbi:P-loop containing nucleoside triphosphate hydrolase [Vigna unguiculata]|uniref:P-loop containing nucleoside triphosphate hydrolase n=1 Tax=Vigna unguiculata TaxID=3917 RepID=A0A4D6LMJ7_VIGUN|nr:P-loop containing nucleoside triphosphate hydrolase [Vigna unguiculata]
MLFLFVEIRGFLIDIKPALLSALDTEYEKNSFELPREDISGKITLTLLKNLGSPRWKDIIILNKVDLVSADSSGALEKLEEEIHNINSLAKIIHSVRYQVDLSRILNRQA